MDAQPSSQHAPCEEDWKARLRLRKAEVEAELQEIHREAERKVQQFHRKLDESIRRSR
jgi:hypothetical protein